MQGTFKLFNFRGIQVYMHFTWFLYAAFRFTQRTGTYTNSVFAAYEYLALFGIVLLHEFGHALACRQTGGTANQIVLWPLGGVAFVQPPRRPGAVLWSIAAGPLVNVALIPVFEVVWRVANQGGWNDVAPDTYNLVRMIRLINYSLLVFNMLPIYPLDGGQILQALLWFPLGEIRSLQIASVIGIVGAVALAGLAFLLRIDVVWIAILAFFMISRAIAGWQYAKAMIAEEKERERPTDLPANPQF